MEPRPEGSDPAPRPARRGGLLGRLEPLLKRLPDRLVAALVLRRLPRAAVLEVTAACNLRCPLCPTHLVERGGLGLRPEDARNVAAGCGGRLRNASLHLMGEPLLSPDLWRIVAELARAGVASDFATNGVLLDAQRDALLDSDLAQVTVALDGVDQADYARYRRGGELARVVANVRGLLAERRRRGLRAPRVRLQMIQFSYNEDREDEARRFLGELGADEVVFKRPSYASFDTPEARAFLAQVDTSATRRYARSGYALPYRERRLCPQLTRATVLADGRVVACCMDARGEHALGNLREQGFRSIWRGPRRAALIRAFLAKRLELCRHCTLGDEPPAAPHRRSVRALGRTSWAAR